MGLDKFYCLECGELLYELRLQNPLKFTDEGKLIYFRYCKKCNIFFKISPIKIYPQIGVRSR
ncbi:hypothetical protein ES703_09520 [subsurface metagenome]